MQFFQADVLLCYPQILELLSLLNHTVTAVCDSEEIHVNISTNAPQLMSRMLLLFFCHFQDLRRQERRQGGSSLLKELLFFLCLHNETASSCVFLLLRFVISSSPEPESTLHIPSTSWKWGLIVSREDAGVSSSCFDNGENVQPLIDSIFVHLPRLVR